MKTINLLKSILLTAMIIVGTMSAVAETLFSFTGTGASNYSNPPAAGWTTEGTLVVNAYFRLDPGVAIISPLYEPHTDLSFSYSIARHRTNIDDATETVLIVLNAEGGTIKQISLVSTTASTSSYENDVIDIGDVNSKFRIKILTTATNQRTILRNTILSGTPSTVTPTEPTITVTESSIPAMQAEVGNSDAQTINVSGSDLTANIELTIEGTDAGQFSVLPETLTQTGGAVASTEVTVRYSPTVSGPHTATLKITSTGATEKTFELSGSTDVPQELVVTSIDEHFADNTKLPDGWSGKDYSFYSSGTTFIALITNGGEIITPKVKNPKNLSLSLYRTSDAVAKTLYVMVSTTIDGPYTTVATFNHDNTATAYTEYPVDLSAYSSSEVYIKFLRESTGSSPWRIDWIKVTGDDTPTGISENTGNLNLYSNNGYIHFNSTAGQPVEIYNTLGICLYNGVTSEGLNSIKAEPGIVLVRIGDDFAGKVMLR